MSKEKKIVSVENTKFIFRTNFSGDPDRDSFGSTARKANIIIPDEQQALDLREEGFNIKQTKPREGEEEDYIPKYFTSVSLNYDSEWPPKVYLVTGSNMPVLLDEESIGILDKIYVTNVDVVLNPYHNQRTGRNSLYVKTMYVEQDVEDDPFASKYLNRE